MPRRTAMQENITVAETPKSQMPFDVTITEHNPEQGVLATADVRVGDMLTIRNVKIKQDDYGLTVSMPRTKEPHTGQYKDSVFFADFSVKQQFDQAVGKAYQDTILSADMDEEEDEERKENKRKRKNPLYAK